MYLCECSVRISTFVLQLCDCLYKYFYNMTSKCQMENRGIPDESCEIRVGVGGEDNLKINTQEKIRKWP